MKLICNYCEAHMPEVPEGSGNHVCPNGHHSSTPQSPKEALPGRYWIRPNPPYKAGVLFCGTDAEYEKVMPSCRDGLFPYVPESALAEAVRKARELALAYGRLQALEHASISPCVLPSMLKSAKEEYRSALKASTRAGGAEGDT